jgi:prepilin-type processing-associated H-X9-DG protein
MSQVHDESASGDGAGAPQKMSRFWLNAIVICVGVGSLVACLVPLRRDARPAAYRNSCSVNLKNIALALEQYHNKHHAYPPAYTVDADGRPLHSWRTLILPHLEKRALYNSIDLSKAWDDPANAAAYQAQSPEIYRCPSAGSPENHTTYLAVVTPTSCLRPVAPRRQADIKDGLSNTIDVIEVAPKDSVHWMAPVDADEAMVLSLGPDSKLAHPGGMNVAYCDGRVIFVPATLPKETWRALISIGGNDDATIEDRHYGP